MVQILLPNHTTQRLRPFFLITPYFQLGYILFASKYNVSQKSCLSDKKDCLGILSPSVLNFNKSITADSENVVTV